VLTRRTVLTGGAAGVALPLLGEAGAGPASAAGPPGPVPARLEVATVLARDLRVPWGLAFLPSGDALVGERVTGRVHRVDRHGGRREVGRLRAVDPDAGEGGLLGIAVAPTFAADRWVYFYLTTADDNRIVRRRYVDGRLRRTEVLLSGIPRGASNHNGGRLAFGPSGHLFASTGDARADRLGQTSGSLAQDWDSLAGKILRLEPDGSVPAGNPKGNYAWTRGHRNVEGITWDHRGRMWATELGESTRDELNRIRKGRNYGWPRVEGGDGDGPVKDPFVTWSPTSSCSPSGVAVAAGRAWVGALAGHCLYSVRLNGDHAGRKVRHLHNRFGRIRTVEKAPDGSLWITTSNRDGRGDPTASDDRVIRLRV
jgi:glucose/arabinose dehydrogenase